MHITAPPIKSKRHKILEVLETAEVAVFYKLGVGPCSFRHGGRETAKQSKCENEDLMLLMSTQKNETVTLFMIYSNLLT